MCIRDSIRAAPRGVPQIEVTFALDANGILTVSATDKDTGKSESITIANDKGRLSQDDIDRMVEEAEKYAAEDAKFKAKSEARNTFENFVHYVKNSVNGELAEIMDEDDKETVLDNVNESLEWLEDNSDVAEAEDFEEKMASFKESVEPILAKASASQGSTSGEGFEDEDDDDYFDDEL